MNDIVGADGKKAQSEADQPPDVQYVVGGIEMGSPEPVEMVLQRALLGAKQMAGQAAGQGAMQQVNDHGIAQQAANAAANACNNPFFIEPAAQAVFMLMSREIEWRDGVIAQLCERLDKLDGESSEVLLKKPWPGVQGPQDEIAPKGDTFDDAVKNLAGKNAD